METSLSRNVLTETKINGGLSDESTMLYLEKAISEAEKKNYSRALCEFNKSFVESNGNEDIFTSNLLQLTLKDLEYLFICLFGCDKNRRFSKQHDKKSTSIKKNKNVGFINDGYIVEFSDKHKEQNKTQSLRGYKPTNDQNDDTPIKECLRKAFYLSRDLTNLKSLDKSVQKACKIHCRAGNIFSCASLLLQHKDKKFIDEIIYSFTDEEKTKICNICMSVASNTNTNNNPRKFLSNMNLDFCLLAYRISPKNEKANELLCFNYRQRNNYEKAFNIAKSYLDTVKPNSKDMIIQLLMCDIDCGKKEFVLERLEQLIMQYKEDTSEFVLLKSLLLMDQSSIEEAIKIITTIKNNEYKAKLKYLTEQINNNIHENIVNNLYEYFTEWKNKNSNRKISKDEKIIYIMMTQLLTWKNNHGPKYAKLYGDCLTFCGEYEIASQYFLQLIKYRENDNLPMMHLATLRLKMGAYNAATEDFRAIISIVGNEKFMKDLACLNTYELEEIARVHRVYAFKYLTKNLAYKEAAECFSVVICALGPQNASAIYLMRGLCYMHLNKFKEAKSDYNKCLEIDNSAVSAFFSRAVVFAVTTHVQEAINDFVNAYKSNPNACKQIITKLPLEHVLTFSQLLIQFIKQEVERVKNISNSFFAIDDIKPLQSQEKITEPFNLEVVKYCEFLCTIFPNNIDYISTYIECLLVAKQVNNALRFVDTHINRFPHCNILSAWKAVILTSLNRIEEAITCLQILFEIDDAINHIFKFMNIQERKQLIGNVLHHAASLTTQGHFHEAIIFYDIAVQLTNREVDVLKKRMNCYEKIGDIAKWKEELCDIIAVEPTAALLQMRAKYYQNNCENYLACEDFMSALELNEGETIINVTINSNGSDVVEMFYQTALQMYELDRPKVVLRLCETGLKFDHKHKGLKHLKDGAKMNLAKCIIQ